MSNILDSSPKPPRPPSARSPVAGFLFGWALATLFVLSSLAVVFVLSGKRGLESLFQEGPHSELFTTLLSVAVAWGLAGLALVWVAARRASRSDIVVLAGFFCLALLYVNVLRERPASGDFRDYFDAASSLRLGTPLPAGYLYPPLWATVLAPLVPLGRGAVFYLCWLLNLLSLSVFYFLLHFTLVRYGFSSVLAALTAFLFAAVNVPILRTLGYMQVNLHVVDLVLASLLAYPRHRFGSALALAVAAHLKLSPMALLLAFLPSRDFRWLGWFVVCLVGVALVPLVAHGVSPYLRFVENIRHIHDANLLAYRENSIDSFFRATSMVTGLPPAWLPVLIGGVKVLLVAACILIAVRSVRRRSFVSGEGAAGTVYNAVPSLLVLMVMVSPLVWEHHPILMGLSYLVIVKALSSARQWLWFGLAYFLEFLLPTFDLYPWSYGRLVSPLILLWLMGSVRGGGPTLGFQRVNEFFAGLSSNRVLPAREPVPGAPFA